MDVSIFLAKVLGLYLFIVSISMLVNASMFKKVLKEAIHNPPMMLFSGATALIFGLLIVVSHNIWSHDWRIVITIIGWLALLKGIFRFAAPEQAMQFNENFIKHDKAFTIVSAVTLLLGLYLCFHGFM